jgi:glutaconate CoA-transferase subunit B
MVAHERKRFAKRVTYMSSPGYLDGGDARARHGFVGGGPAAVITTLGVLRPNPATKEFELDGWFPFSSVEEIKANTGWDLKLSAQAQVIAEPTEAELSAMRKVDETGALRRR